MEGKGAALFWVVLSILVCIFGTLVMQLRESVAETNRVIKSVELRSTADIEDLKNRMQQDYKQRLERLENEFRSELKQLKLSVESSGSGRGTEKLEESVGGLRQELEKLETRQQTVIQALAKKVSDRKQTTDSPTARNCQDLLKEGHTKDGVFKIVDPTGTDPNGVSIYCDMTFNHASGGWMVFQRRSDQTVTFDRNWRDYHDGFGDPTGDFWLGNKYVRALTADELHELRIDMWDSDGLHRYATYTDFSLGPAEQNYTISFGSYAGDAGDSLVTHSKAMFSTYDVDNDKFADGSCADMWKSGWWFTDCLRVSLNGKPGQPSWNGLKWEGWHWKDDAKMIKAEMKIRPMVI